ncbi:MAG: malto-oligosyltrehalose trehalohydrolase [Gammaproteobacteria bacterium]|nr:malto-oligosyltrehalose trehalohydrolase [Gammaproteobacteria bacterium]
MRRRHSMPFGAELTATGEVRFRLWAPAAREVELLLCDAAGAPVHATALAPLGNGWFSLLSSAARSGSLYRYRIDGTHEVPDPASRCNPHGVHGPSEVIDPAAYGWRDLVWQAPPWHEVSIYELHVGTFNSPGTYASVAARLAHLKRLGVAAIELMPLGAFPGARNWGYDGVLPYAPQASYGRPEELKALIDAAHGQGLAVLLDVVYNHFGPEGNYLHLYAPQFFTEDHHTPWGAAINFDGAGSRTVRDFFIHNALYWLEEYHLDGLRLDAVDAICDDSVPHILTELAQTVRAGPGARRRTYLTLENLRNSAALLGPENAPDRYDAQWNDDLHHSLHVLLTGESQQYYSDFSERPQALLARALAEGFAYQGERSRFAGRARGEPSAQLPASAFIGFLQNHDQVGNRPRGERIAQLVHEPAALRAAIALLLLAPHPPLLFMGEEWATPQPFWWFCDYEPQLLEGVRAQRAREVPGAPDPGDPATFAAAQLDWSLLREAAHARLLTHYRRLLTIRRRDLVPLLPQLGGGRYTLPAHGSAFAVDWSGSDRTLHLIANLDAAPAPLPAPAAGRVIFATHPGVRASLARNELAPWSVLWLLEQRGEPA